MFQCCTMQVSGNSEPNLQKFLFLTCFGDRLRLPSAMLRNVADLPGVPDAVVFEATFMNFIF
jgi:hypothetical protein